jgi:hypothetical protein
MRSQIVHDRDQPEPMHEERGASVPLSAGVLLKVPS